MTVVATVSQSELTGKIRQRKEPVEVSARKSLPEHSGLPATPLQECRPGLRRPRIPIMLAEPSAEDWGLPAEGWEVHISEAQQARLPGHSPRSQSPSAALSAESSAEKSEIESWHPLAKRFKTYSNDSSAVI